MRHMLAASKAFFKSFAVASGRARCPGACRLPPRTSPGKNFFSTLLGAKKMDSLVGEFDFVGFDLDNTLCEYNLNAMVRMEYDVMSDILVGRGYPRERLKAELDAAAVDFLQRGLILDFQRGNVLKLDGSGRVMRATHGTRLLEKDGLEAEYGSSLSGNCPLFNRIRNNLTEAWEPSCIARYRLLLDYFDLPASLAFARCVDVATERGERDFTQCGLDTVSALRQMYSRDHFPDDRSEFFRRLKAEPERYVLRSDPKLISWLKNLRKSKRLFLVTGSNCDLADLVARHSLGPAWRDLFDVVVCFARKPFFFIERNEFRQVEDLREGAATKEISLGRLYTQGSWAELEEALRKSSSNGGAAGRSLYFGDNLVQDVFTPSRYSCCETVAIVEELNDNHPSRQLIASSFWGPMQAEGSLWGAVLATYPKAVLPSINAIC